MDTIGAVEWTLGRGDGVGERRLVGFALLTLEFHKEGQLWVGQCLELGTACDGRSIEKVREHLTRLVTLHLNGLEQIGERDRIFKERGIKFYTDGEPSDATASVSLAEAEKDVYLRIAKIPLSPAPTDSELVGVGG